ncbi:hypothetical protein IAU60_004815 [Kwoniella sp. DSM 27419]
MSTSYQPIPSSSPPASRSTSPRYPAPPSASDSAQHETDPSYRPLRRSVQEEFDRPPPSWWTRVLLVLVLLGMGWASVWLGGRGIKAQEGDKPTIIYANRYSDEHKYRPASSPVITEYLPGNRIRLRGASIGGVGVAEEEVPLTPPQKAAQEKKRRQEAKDRAREKMGLRVKKRKGLKEFKEEDQARAEELRRKIMGRAQEPL